MTEVILIVLMFVVPLFLICGLTFFRPSLQGGWKSYLGWEAVPLLQFLFFFVLIASINWPYESKLLIPRTAADFVDSNLGPILLTFALVSALLSSALLFTLRLLSRWLFGLKGRWYFWFPAAILGLGICLLIVGSASTVLLGPAAMTMRDQMTHVPNPNP